MLDCIDDWLTLVTDLKYDILHYIREHFWFITSGMFSRPPLTMAIRTVGIDRILFAVDYPYSSIDDGVQFLENVDIAPGDLEKITHLNAERILGLSSERGR